MKVPETNRGDSHPLRTSEPGSPGTGTGLQALEDFADRVHESGRQLILCGAREQPSLRMHEAEFHEHVGKQNICRSVADALERAKVLFPEGAKQGMIGTTWGRRSTDLGSANSAAAAASTPER